MSTNLRKTIIATITFVLFIVIWHLYVTLFKVPEHILPKPLTFATEFVNSFTSGYIYPHITTTLYEIFVGFIIGSALGLLAGYVLAKQPLLERLVTPYIVLVQTMPKISIAPLFLLWFGLGANSKIALVILVVFFPIMVNFVVGIRSVEKNMKDLLSILRANRWQKFKAVEFPSSLSAILSGAKVATTYAITGAVIGELIGADSGLGYMVILGSETYDINMILIAVTLLSLLGLALYLFVDFVERKFLHWQESQKMIM